MSSISTKKKKTPAEILIGIALSLNINLGKTEIFAIFSLPAHEYHGVFPFT